MNTTLKLQGTMEGNKPSEVIEYLTLRVGGISQPFVAYLKGNGYVKLFTNEEFNEWYCKDKEVTARDITQAVYDNDLLLERFVKVHFMGLTVPQEELMFGHLGNGVTVCDRLREENGDYLTVAHISYERGVTYYKTVSEEGKQRIERFAQAGNMTQSATQPHPVLKPIASQSEY
ncbi:hypothetical protein [Bacteroides neonati]|uniref:hypothetical protein n=1 Tax=Bacteroides neonati TaxID=1347393 RepID=UPI0004B39035|nr:hypothetical protein [Bacteroides neonati]